MDILPPLTTLCLGILIGYFGQRARMCFIGGIRDYFLVRDFYLLKGLFTFLLSAFISFFIFHFISSAIKTFPWFLNGSSLSSPILPVPGDPISSSPKVWAHIILAIIGGFGLGFFSTLAGGCPFRQHVMAAEGSKSAITYLLGFYLGAVIFHKFIGPFIGILFK